MSGPGMPCPVDGTQLIMSERQGIEIDYCPNCRGVWLDRGELDKLVERAANAVAPQVPQPRHAPQPHAPQPPHYGHQTPYYGKRKKSWLSEIFD